MTAKSGKKRNSNFLDIMREFVMKRFEVLLQGGVDAVKAAFKVISIN
jgi:hypothetical protein